MTHYLEGGIIVIWAIFSAIGSFAATINLDNSKKEKQEDKLLEENDRLRMQLTYFKRHHNNERSNSAALVIQEEWREYNRYSDM